ncbi:hypothetical protein Q7P37_000665 [Cladosporium fusiforme]
MEKLEKFPSASDSSGGDDGEHPQETKQARLDRFREAAWFQAGISKKEEEEEEEDFDNKKNEEGSLEGSDSGTTMDTNQQGTAQDGALPPPTRPQRIHANSCATVIGSAKESQVGDMPQLKRELTKLANKKSHPMEHLGITLGVPMILLCDLIIPCIIYYTWYNRNRAQWQDDCSEWHSRDESCPIEKPQFNENIMGYAVVCFGFGELYVLLARVWRLFFRQEQCAPLLSRNRWELDATSWVYLVAMLIALVPFVAGASLTLPKLYLYGPAFLMAFLGVLMVITTLHPFNIPIGINSHARGSGLRPFIYYAAEDFIAVDGLQDREFRIRYNERYERSKSFRQMFVWLTLWWELGVLIYIGCLSAIIWNVEFHIAFGLSFGLLFSWIIMWAFCSWLYVQWEMNRQRKAFEAGKDDV